MDMRLDCDVFLDLPPGGKCFAQCVFEIGGVQTHHFGTEYTPERGALLDVTHEVRGTFAEHFKRTQSGQDLAFFVRRLNDTFLNVDEKLVELLL